MDFIVCQDYDWLYSKKAFSIFRYCMYQPNYINYLKKIKLLNSDPDVKIYLCVYNNINAGILILKFTEIGAEMIGIAVQKKYRTLGIGKFLITHAIKLEQIKFLTAQTDFQAVGFYRNCGFKIIPELKKYDDGNVIRYNVYYNVC